MYPLELVVLAQFLLFLDNSMHVYKIDHCSCHCTAIQISLLTLDGVTVIISVVVEIVVLLSVSVVVLVINLSTVVGMTLVTVSVKREVLVRVSVKREVMVIYTDKRVVVVSVKPIVCVSVTVDVWAWVV